MTQVFRFTVPGSPRSKLRHRSRLIQGKIVSYSPKKNKVAEEAIKEWFLRAMAEHQAITESIRDNSAVTVNVHAEFIPPRSWSKKKRKSAVEGHIPHTTKPDPDNVLKLICDALEGLAYRNDKQIVQTSCTKSYNNTAQVNVEILYHGAS